MCGNFLVTFVQHGLLVGATSGFTCGIVASCPATLSGAFWPNPFRGWCQCAACGERKEVSTAQTLLALEVAGVRCSPRHWGFRRQRVT